MSTAQSISAPRLLSFKVPIEAGFFEIEFSSRYISLRDCLSSFTCAYDRSKSCSPFG